MTASAARSQDAFGPHDRLRLGREIVASEGQALLALAASLGDEFLQTADLLHECRGSVIVSGMGKAGLVGQKIAATLASTGTRSHFLHPGEAIHGDLGRIHRDDAVLILSFSGQTEEIIRLLPALGQLAVPVVAMTGQPNSPLAKSAAVTLHLGAIREACPLGLAPSTSTTAMLALGDALALVISRMRNFTTEDFARFHPGGSLGLKLAKVEEVMRPAETCRVARHDQSVRQALVAQSRPGRRTGAIMIVDESGRLAGIFTDSDLVRLLEGNRDDAIDGPIAAVMTRSPAAVPVGTRLATACEVLAQRKISELPVVDGDSRPVGLIDVTDIVGARPISDSQPQSNGSQRLRVVAPPEWSSGGSHEPASADERTA
ncbi:MAG: KpsF/GutQ family sugar-phosphate isomerase [Pirellulaceae bacterium]|nr:KpsF/GutQ family sugar-phosphate isomerase [Pirellulaceae bacterium]